MSAAPEVSANSLPELNERRTVLVTGFGPFEGNAINASWEAVQLLPSLNIAKELGVHLHVEEIPVEYDAVENKIPELWLKYNPMLVVHVGVSDSRCLTMERCARQGRYERKDASGSMPACSTCPGSEEIIYSSLDILGLCQEVNQRKEDVETCISTDAGRYLCEYIYYKSLSIDNSRCVFIHVPKLGLPYSAKQTALGIGKIIDILVRQVRNRGNALA